MKHFKDLVYLIAAIAIVTILAARIFHAQTDIMMKADTDCSNGRAIVINKSTNPQLLAAILTKYGYIQSDEESSFIAHRLISLILKGEAVAPNCIKDLEDDQYGIELNSEGFSSIESYPYLLSRALQLAGGEDIDYGKQSIIDTAASEKYMVRIKNEKGGIHHDTVYLCIKEHYNEVYEEGGKVIDCQTGDSIYTWVPVCGKTVIWLPVKNSQGFYRYFSILPIERGFSYGSSHGTYHNRKHSFKFIRKRAILPLFGKKTLKQMREDNSILVRSPQEYRDKFITTIVLFGAVWLFVFLALSIIDKKRNGNSNLELLAFVALLSGIGLVNLFNLQNPLWGELFAWSQLFKGLLLGAFLLVMCSFIDWINLYRWFHKKHLSTRFSRPEGIGLAISAILIAIILLIFGHGPGGTHVTLPLLPIQGSPLIKIFVIGYIAVVFASRSQLLEAYAKPGKGWKQLATLITVLLIIFILGLLQLMISDLGPFLVIAITAIFAFSLATKETPPMLIWTGGFCSILWLTRHFVHYSFLPYAIFIVYTAIWSLYSYYRFERVKLSPVALCLVFLLAFHGGTLFSFIGKEDIAERLNGRTEMATNIFDNEVVGGSQIAQGIWAIARGGHLGSPEKGLSSTIPAGHTDLVFESLIENLGIWCGVFILIGIGYFLFKTLKISIRNGHPFGFAFGSLIALSISIQSVLIVLGSMGCLGIPLTGVTLPFISFSGTALSVDLACVGILISLSRHKDYELECLNTQRYEKMSRGQIWAYICLAAIAFMAVMNYGFISRDHYLVYPGKFINNSGERITLTNPLIDATEKQLIPGDILDRKGKVLATTNGDGVRIYPYHEYTLFMTGDDMTKVLSGTTGKRSTSLNAEERFRSTIRGYDTQPVKMTLQSTRHYSPFLPDVIMNKEETVIIKNYSALLPMMKSPKEIQKWNEHMDEKKIQLTIDAELQTVLSKGEESFVQRQKRTGITNDRTRVITVIIDAVNGDLLTSAMYPLPDQTILKELAITNTTIYRDWTTGFKAYVGMDLALVPFEPGSTSKLYTAGAGFLRFSTELAGPDYNQMVFNDEIVDISLGEPTGVITLKQAIVKSSNIYFIKLLNKYGEKGLYPELGKLFYATGVGFGKAIPYVLYPDQVITSEQSYRTQVENFGMKAADKYSRYEASGTRHRLIDSEYQPAWGQGEVSMTPLALCRYVAACANNGKMMYPRYEFGDSVRLYQQLLSTEEAQVMQDCMKGQAAGRFGNISEHIGGKTGTPSRSDRSKPNGKSNDALYCFFVDAEGTTEGHPLAIVIRIERVNDYSRLAIQMAEEVVIPALREKGYIY